MSLTTGISAAPRRVVIVGDGLDAWLAAAALAAANGDDGRHVTVVPETDAAPCPALDATLPLPPGSHAGLRVIDDHAIVHSGGTFAFGIAMSGWSAPGATYFHPFGSPGAGLGSVNFVHIVMRLRREGLPIRFGNYSMAALAAQAGRFAKPVRSAASVLSTCDYGLHVDSPGLCATVRDRATDTGISITDGRFDAVLESSAMTLDAVTTTDGKRVDGDLFLDCTSTGLLFADDPWQDWTAWLRCNQSVAAVRDLDAMPPPYSHASAHRAGWTRQLTVQGTSMHCTYFDGSSMTENEATAVLQQAVDGRRIPEFEAAVTTYGRRTTPWRGNRVAIGRAAARMDPVAVSDLDVTISGIDRLLKLLPADADASAESKEYNRLSEAWLDNARDFAILHYKLNGRRGEAFWDARREMSVPESLDYKMRLYQSRGRVALYDEEPLEEFSWINVFDEHGIEPRQYNRIADGFSRSDLEAHLERIRTIMIDELGRMPAHGDYLATMRDATHGAGAKSR